MVHRSTENRFSTAPRVSDHCEALRWPAAPQVPTLDEVRRYARARLAQTPSLDDIAVSARQRLLELVHSRLVEAAQAPTVG